MLLPVAAADASHFLSSTSGTATTLGGFDCLQLLSRETSSYCCAVRGVVKSLSGVFLVWEIFLLLLLLRSVSAPTKAVERGNALSRRREWHGTTLFVASIYCPLAFVSNSDVRRDDNVDNKRLGACC